MSEEPVNSGSARRRFTPMYSSAGSRRRTGENDPIYSLANYPTWDLGLENMNMAYCKNRNKRGIFHNKCGFLCRQIETKIETIFITILPLVCAFLVASKVHLFCTIFFHVYSELSHVYSGYYSILPTTETLSAAVNPLR